MKSFEYQPLFRIGIPTRDGRIFHASGVWRLRMDCLLLRAESREGQSLAVGVVDGLLFSNQSAMAYASGEAEPEIAAGLMLKESVLVPELETWGRKVERVRADDGENVFAIMEGTIVAVHVMPKEQWPW